MKIRPVILCGGAGTRLWPNSKNHQAKQFIDFGNWTLLGKTLDRVKSSTFDAPIISTNLKYLKEVKKHLKKHKISKYKIVLEPAKRNTAPAILASALIKDIPNEQSLMFFAADHLIEKASIFNKAINKNKTNLTDQNIFIFGIKPTAPPSEYGYFITKKVKGNINKVIKFIEEQDIEVMCLQETKTPDEHFPSEHSKKIGMEYQLSLIHISEPTRLGMNSYAVFCLKKKTTRL